MKLSEVFPINWEVISLSFFDDKRYLHDDAQTSCAYGHYKI